MRKLTPKLCSFSSTLVGSEDGSWKFANVDGVPFMAMPASLETLTVVPQEEYARVTGEEISPCAR